MAILDSLLKRRFFRIQHIAKTSNPPANVHFKTLDFFDFPLPADGKKFNLAYDYTFLCALPPSLRESWGKRYAEIIETDGESGLCCYLDIISTNRRFPHF